MATARMQMTSSAEEADVEVTREDQSRINEFGRLNARKHEAKDELAEAQKKLEVISDSESSVMLADESIPGAIKLMIGDVFIDSDSATASTFIDAEKAKLSATVARLQAEVSSIEERHRVLKTQLYAKFGKNINLEES